MWQTVSRNEFPWSRNQKISRDSTCQAFTMKPSSHPRPITILEDRSGLTQSSSPLTQMRGARRLSRRSGWLSKSSLSDWMMGRPWTSTDWTRSQRMTLTSNVDNIVQWSKMKQTITWLIARKKRCKLMRVRLPRSKSTPTSWSKGKWKKSWTSGGKEVKLTQIFRSRSQARQRSWGCSMATLFHTARVLASTQIRWGKRKPLIGESGAWSSGLGRQIPKIKMSSRLLITRPAISICLARRIKFKRHKKVNTMSVQMKHSGSSRWPWRIKKWTHPCRDNTILAFWRKIRRVWKVSARIRRT